jgi:hypothetical protein
MAPGAVTVLATGAARAWISFVHPGPVATPSTAYGPRTLLAIPLGRLGELYAEMIGRLGGWT